MTDYTKEDRAIIKQTPQEALVAGERLLADTGVSFTVMEARGIIAGLIEAIKSSPCFYQAILTARKTFVLIDSDPAAAHAIYEWTRAAAKVGHREEKVEDARRIAEEFRSHPFKKTPS